MQQDVPMLKPSLCMIAIPDTVTQGFSEILYTYIYYLIVGEF